METNFKGHRVVGLWTQDGYETTVDWERFDPVAYEVPVWKPGGRTPRKMHESFWRLGSIDNQGGIRVRFVFAENNTLFWLGAELPDEREGFRYDSRHPRVTLYFRDEEHRLWCMEAFGGEPLTYIPLKRVFELS